MTENVTYCDKHVSSRKCLFFSDVFDMKKAIAIKLNDHYAKLTGGSCPSHHSPNDVIPLSNDNTCLWLGNLNHV